MILGAETKNQVIWIIRCKVMARNKSSRTMVESHGSPQKWTLLCVFLTGRPARIISGQSARNIHKNKSCKPPQTKNTSDRVIFRSKTHKILKFSE